MPSLRGLFGAELVTIQMIGRPDWSHLDAQRRDPAEEAGSDWNLSSAQLTVTVPTIPVDLWATQWYE
jgi:hypothetical protein